MQPIITVFCPFTRRWAVDQWLDNLAALNVDPAQTHLAITIDIDEPYILNQCRKFAAKYGYRSFQFKMNQDHSPNEIRLGLRRLRIADIKNQSKFLISNTDCEYVLGLEDDTVFEGMDICRLLTPLVNSPHVGFVEGVQAGRHDTKMIGAWRANELQDPTEITTILPPQDGSEYEQITGGGFYGYMTRRELYLNCEYYASSAQPWGPDVNFGMWLRQRGFRCLIDWRTRFGHNDHNRITWPDQAITEARFIKNKATGMWERQDADRTAKI
jgi:hypothetical protein